MVNLADVCHRILYQLQLSQLNFKVTETSYSAEIVLRKRFIKNSRGPAESFLESTTSVKNEDLEKLENENEVLEHQNLQLRDSLKDGSETMKLLEEKIERSETQAMANF